MSDYIKAVIVLSSFVLLSFLFWNWWYRRIRSFRRIIKSKNKRIIEQDDRIIELNKEIERIDNAIKTTRQRIGHDNRRNS